MSECSSPFNAVVKDEDIKHQFERLYNHLMVGRMIDMSS